jgi:hypothetical protein
LRFRRSRRREEAATQPVRETLFGDVPLDQWPAEGVEAEGFPWTAFREARARAAAGAVDDATRSWQSVVAHPGLESRHYLQAWQFLREHGERPTQDLAPEVLGVVVEMSSPDGLDLLAVYADGSARYYNHAGGGIVLERADGALAELIQALLAAGQEVVAAIGPWEGARPGPPARNHARLSFLTPSGLHFGEGPVDALEADAVAGPVLRGAAAVMTELVAAAASDA